MKKNIEKIMIGFLESITTKYTRLLLNHGSNKLFEHYRNIVSVIVAMDHPKIYEYAWLIDQYLYSIDTIKKYYAERETRYMYIDGVLSERLLSEINTLILHGALVSSRLLFLAANFNRLNHVNMDELPVYARRIHEVLSMPVPPWADDGRIIDLLDENDKVALFPGTIVSSWIVKGFIKYMYSRGVDVKTYLCMQRFNDYLYAGNYHRMLRSENIEFIDCSNPYNVMDTVKSSSRNRYFIVNNYLFILAVVEYMDYVEGWKEHNILLVFNPVDTPLEELYMGKRQIVSRLEEFVNLFK